MSIRRSSITVFVAMFAASTLSACGDQRQDDAQGPGQEASASAGSGLISAQSGFAEMDLASVKAVKSFGLCAVDAINGHGGKDAAKTINLTRAGKVKVSGWAVTPDKRSPSSVAVVLLGTEKAYALRADGGRARADVARSVDSEAAGNAGYSAESQLEGVAPGRYAVSILQDSDGAPTVCATRYKVMVQGE